MENRMMRRQTRLYTRGDTKIIFDTIANRILYAYACQGDDRYHPYYADSFISFSSMESFLKSIETIPNSTRNVLLAKLKEEIYLPFLKENMKHEQRKCDA